MYDSSITSEYLAQQHPVVIIQQKSGDREIPFELTYHSPEEVTQATKFFDDLINQDLYKKTKEGSNVKIEFINPQRKPDLEELIWMENERILCKWDCNYYLTRYYQILNAQGVYETYNPLIPQKVNMRILARLQKAQRAIRKLTLKARQQGETTWSQGVIGHRLAFFPDVVSLIASYDSKSSAKLGKMFMDGINRLPWWNRPHLKAFTTGEEYKFENNSYFDLGYGTQDSLGRGRTPLVAHLSELPFYTSPEKSIEDALFNAMHESIWMIQLLEGTAEVRDDYFHKKVNETISGMEAGTTSLVFCFHPWCARRDLFPTETWLKARSDTFETWSPSSKTIAHATKLRNWVLSNKDYREEFGSNWHLSREQMFYYELEKNAAIARNALQAFLKEKPSDPEEAFQHAGQSIYPVQTIISISDAAQSVIPEVYKLRGDPNEINPEFFPTDDEIKLNGNRITIRADWNPAIPFSGFELIEIDFNGWDNFDPVNKFLIWEMPQLGAQYGLATDTSDGLGRLISDDAAMQVLKKGTIEYKDKQVCEFVSPEIPQNMFWPWNLALATLYSPEEQLLFVPEINKGTELLNAMVQRGWGNIFKMMDMTKLARGVQEGKKYGFETNKQTRPDLINHVNSFILGGWVEIFSMELVKELKDLVKKRTVSTQVGTITDKILGKNDNRFLAFGICLYALHRDEILGLQKASWEERIRNENSKIALKSFQPDDFSREDALITYNSDEEFFGEMAVLEGMFADEGY